MTQSVALTLGPGDGYEFDPMDALVTNLDTSAVALGDVMTLQPNATTGIFETMTVPVAGDVTKGVFAVCLEAAGAGQYCHVRIRGKCYAFTKNSAGAGGNAIVNGNLYAATTAKDLESDTATYGLNAKLIARAIDTGTAAATNTRALRQVIVDGFSGFGGIYGGTG